ncbi:MAG TPA: 2-C-methyl-D-erythritol 4-phosphate cytidylyltransferase [Candidatus Cryptobacteroides sp.]|nr:2-C-methyl-D-erythritol 4-phosphate cytidylyltransferase [Candidatus Cryptobacteroides sp.]
MTERKKYLVVVAGGSGSRMGSKIPKQFLELDGMPILQRTIERFVEAEPDIHVVTVLPKAHRALWEELCSRHNFNRPQILADGGITRFHSVQNALEKVPDGAITAIHDGVRPLVSVALIRKMFALMSGGVRALIPVMPITDTLHLLDKSEDGPAAASASPASAVGTASAGPSASAISTASISKPATADLLQLATAPDAEVPDRSRLFGAQTPQMFRSEDIKAAYRDTGFRIDFTDDASVARAYKIPLSYIAGERFNIKITTPEDLSLAELLLTF